MVAQTVYGIVDHWPDMGFYVEMASHLERVEQRLYINGGHANKK